MLSYEARITIDAPPEAVWAVLVDTDRWPEWDPYCEKIEGAVALGGTVKAFTTLAPGRAFPVKVATLDAPRRMVWQGGMPLGLFKGVRSYALAPEGEGTAFHMREEFSGLLLPLFKGSLPDMTEPFQKFAEGLKGRVEGQGGA